MCNKNIDKEGKGRKGKGRGREEDIER